ncbi:MAG TPA: hypothetical protein VKB26_14745 [Candidatus Acidoferrales bacterium]|nr:hypothetical protein [Candidatus Acidoferrales bacterium]
MTSSTSAVGYALPHVCRTDARTRHAVNFLLIALSGLFLLLTVLYLAGILPHRGPISGLFWIDLIIAAIVLGLGSGYNKRAILREDSIEVKGWFRSRKLTFSEIRGRQILTSSRGLLGRAYLLVPSDQNKRKLGLPIYLHMDHFFRDWYNALPEVPR